MCFVLAPGPGALSPTRALRPHKRPSRRASALSSMLMQMFSGRIIMPALCVVVLPPLPTAFDDGLHFDSTFKLPPSSPRCAPSWPPFCPPLVVDTASLSAVWLRYPPVVPTSAAVTSAALCAPLWFFFVASAVVFLFVESYLLEEEGWVGGLPGLLNSFPPLWCDLFPLFFISLFLFAPPPHTHTH